MEFNHFALPAFMYKRVSVLKFCMQRAFRYASILCLVVCAQVLQLVNVLVGWSEELKAGNAVAALKSTLKPEATVKRDGRWQHINVSKGARTFKDYC